MADQNARQDANRFPALIAHTGTAGTAETERLVSTNGALNVDVISGEIVAQLGTVKVVEGGTIGALAKGTITTGTVDVLKLGTVKVTEGSIVVTAGTVETTIGDLTGGTIDNLAGGSIVVTAGTVETTIGDLTGGTIDNLASGSVVVTAGSIVVTNGTIGDLDTVGTVGVVENGTISKVGTIPGIGVLSLGTVKVTEGTITTTMGDLSGGTIDILTDGTISKVGTIPGIGVLSLGTVKVTEGTITTTMGDLSGGTVDLISAIAAGTQELLGTANKVGTIGVLTAGTVTRVQGGTIGNIVSGSVVVTAGTVKINPDPPTYVTTYGTQITGAAQTWATISSVSGAGTYHYVSGVSAVVKSGTVDCFIGIGSALSGTGVLIRGSFPEGGGIARSFSIPLKSSGTNSEIICQIGGAGTVDFTADFWRGT